MHPMEYMNTPFDNLDDDETKPNRWICYPLAVNSPKHIIYK